LFRRLSFHHAATGRQPSRLGRRWRSFCQPGYRPTGWWCVWQQVCCRDAQAPSGKAVRARDPVCFLRMKFRNLRVPRWDATGLMACLSHARPPQFFSLAGTAATATMANPWSNALSSGVVASVSNAADVAGRSMGQVLRGAFMRLETVALDNSVNEHPPPCLWSPRLYVRRAVEGDTPRGLCLNSVGGKLDETTTGHNLPGRVACVTLNAESQQ
jgi:hypothetical protein